MLYFFSRGAVAQFGSASEWHSEGREFDPPQLHLISLHLQGFFEFSTKSHYGLFRSFYDFFRETWTQNGHIEKDKIRGRDHQKAPLFMEPASGTIGTDCKYVKILYLP
jgi:hypothetical protein